MTVNFLFDRQNKTYFAGETVKCKATLELKQDLALNSITIYYTGTGKTWWTDRTSYGGEVELYECFGSMEQYFHETFICYQSFNVKTFQQDAYKYDTEFTLPRTLPTSFFGRHGQIMYKVRMVITSHLVNTILMESEEEFFVSSVINLNCNPYLRAPVLKCKSKKIGLLWFTSEFITLTTKVSRKGFAVGEHIPLAIHINNQSTVDILYIEIALVEEIICKEKRRSLKKVEENVIWKKCIGGILKCQQKLYEVNIPAEEKLTILLLDGAEIISARYSVVVKAVSKEFRKVVQTKSDLVFGTIGLLKLK